MAYTPIANVDITLQTSGITGRGFGIPIFAASHRHFPERVREYTSLDDLLLDGIPTDSTVYKAALGFLSATPNVTSFKIGRRVADVSIQYDASKTNDLINIETFTGGNPGSFQVQVTGAIDASDLATQIAAAINGAAENSSVITAAAVGDTVNITSDVTTSSYTISPGSNGASYTYSQTESATSLINAITAYDEDWFFFTADDHTTSFILDAAADLEARKRLYFYSSQDIGETTLSGPTTSLGGMFDFSAGIFHHEADSIFPETYFVGYNAPYVPGSVSWSNLGLTLSASQDPSTGSKLSASQKSQLGDANLSYVDNIVGTSILRGGKVNSGEYIDTIHGRENLTEDLKVAFVNLLILQQGSKLPYSNVGINQIAGTTKAILDRYVDRSFIRPDYKMSFPDISSVPTADKQARIYKQGSFEAVITGAINEVDLKGNLALDFNA